MGLARARRNCWTRRRCSSCPTGALDPADGLGPQPAARVLRAATDEPGELEAGVGLFLLPETASAKPGFSLMPYGRGELDVEIPLSDTAHARHQGGDRSRAAASGVNVRPDKDIEFFAGLAAGTPSAVSGNVSALLRLGKEGEPLIIIGGQGPEPARVRRHHHRSGHALPLGRQVRGVHRVRRSRTARSSSSRRRRTRTASSPSCCRPKGSRSASS